MNKRVLIVAILSVAFLQNSVQADSKKNDIENDSDNDFETSNRPKTRFQIANEISKQMMNRRKVLANKVGRERFLKEAAAACNLSLAESYDAEAEYNRYKLEIVISLKGAYARSIHYNIKDEYFYKQRECCYKIADQYRLEAEKCVGKRRINYIKNEMRRIQQPNFSGEEYEEEEGVDDFFSGAGFLTMAAFLIGK